MHPEVSKARAKVAGLTRSVRYGERPPSDLDAAKRELESANTTAHIERLLAKAPPLTDEQRTKLAELLRPVRRPTGGAA